MLEFTTHKLKPYVVISKLKDGSIKLGSTKRNAFIIPKSYTKIFSNLFLSDNSSRILEEELKCFDKTILHNLFNDLLKAELIELKHPVQHISPLNKYRTQSTFFSIFDSPNANRKNYFEKLMSTRLFILGMGGVGCHTSMSLVNSGIKNLTLLDYDIIEESNLNRQILYYPKDIGHLKAETARNNLLKYDPTLNIQTINKEIIDKNDLKVLSDFDIDLLVCTADYPFHYIYTWINEYCIANNIPWIQANSAEASGYVGPFIIPGETSCYGCIEAFWENKNPEYTYEIDYLNKHKELYSEKSSTLCPAIGMIGNFIALEIIKYITGFSKPHTLNKQISLDFGSLEYDEIKYKKSKACKVCSKL